MAPPARHPCIHLVAGRTPGSGPVLAVLTDGPDDPSVAAYAADLAARTGTLLIAAAAVVTGDDGRRVDPRRHRARSRRINADTRAIVARVTPLLHGCGIAYMPTTLPLPDVVRVLPVSAVHHVVNRFGAVAVVTAGPLHDPTGTLRPASEQRPSRPGRLS